MRADVKLSERSSLDLVGGFGEAIDQSAFAPRFRGYKGNLDLELVGGWRARRYPCRRHQLGRGRRRGAYGELAVFRTPEPLPPIGLDDRRVALKAVAGGSYRLPLGNGILTYAEYHYSGFGAANASKILPLLADPEFQERYLRGDTQILERPAIAVLAMYEASPEVALNGQWIQSPVDGSGVASPSLTLTLGDRLSILASFYISFGAPPEGLALASTYGVAADSGFLQVRLYF